MHRPFIHNSLEVRQISLSKYGVFTNSQLARNTKIESCLILPIPRQAHSILIKNKFSATDKLIQNPDGIIKESNILNSIGEMELERRLDAGLLSADDIKRILFDSGNLTQVLDIETHGFLLGYGSIYNKSAYPNVIIEYSPDSKLYDVITVKEIGPHTELTYLTR
jgi:hypothetical protein